QACQNIVGAASVERDDAHGLARIRLSERIADGQSRHADQHDPAHGRYPHDASLEPGPGQPRARRFMSPTFSLRARCTNGSSLRVPGSIRAITLHLLAPRVKPGNSQAMS